MASYDVDTASGSASTNLEFTATWIASTAEIPITVNWCNFLMADGVFEVADMLKDMLKFRIATYRKALFNRKEKPKSVNYKNTSRFRLKIPASRTILGRETRRR